MGTVGMTDKMFWCCALLREVACVCEVAMITLDHETKICFF